MEQLNIFLEKIHIKNFLSLRDVTIPLKPLTVLVGPNASGKTNILTSIMVLRLILEDGVVTQNKLKDLFWADGAKTIDLGLEFKVNEKPVVYQLTLSKQRGNAIATEKLTVGNIEVISLKNGSGEIRDEDGNNLIKYQSNRLALTSAGGYGHKPVTKALAEFIEKWDYYNLDPNRMRNPNIYYSPGEENIYDHVDRLDPTGEQLGLVISNWYKKSEPQFKIINESVADYEIKYENNWLRMAEGYENTIPLNRVSDGRLRMLAYKTLVNQTELPPLIAIEEPERSLHPNALIDVADTLESLSKRTQVIITTHSSDLLDIFSTKELGINLDVLLLQNKKGLGTTVTDLKTAKQNNAGLKDWIEDFGMGSAIFHSELMYEEGEE